MFLLLQHRGQPDLLLHHVHSEVFRKAAGRYVTCGRAVYTFVERTESKRRTHAIGTPYHTPEMTLGGARQLPIFGSNHLRLWGIIVLLFKEGNVCSGVENFCVAAAFIWYFVSVIVLFSGVR